MAFKKTFVDRLADQTKAKKQLIERTRNLSQSLGSVKKAIKSQSTVIPTSSPIVPVPVRPQRPWAQVRAGNSPLTYVSRTGNTTVASQPWAKELVNTLLDAADQGGLTLCLVWPAKLTALPLLHALANVERVFAKDLRGIRTLLYPGTHACRAPLHSVLADRQALSAFYRSLWVRQPTGNLEFQTDTSSSALQAILSALNDLTLHNPQSPNPSFAELIPTFVFDTSGPNWTTPFSKPLARTLAKVEHLAFRRDLREKVNLEWEMPEKAPGALMVLHYRTKKDVWRKALTSSALKGPGRPEILLFDATDHAMRTNYSAVKRIPEFLLCAREGGLTEAGAVIITDDPRSFFSLRAQLRGSTIAFSTKVWAAEAEIDETLISSCPAPINWRPVQRSNSNFNVGIVDREASQVALTFQSLMAGVGNEDSPAHQALFQACMYVLRLSNMPAGYTDLTAISTEAGVGDYTSQQNAWTPVKLALDAALASGMLNAVRIRAVRAIEKANALIDAWNDATPIASRMLAEVRKHAMVNRQRVVLVLPNKNYMVLAHRFLQRKLGEDWDAMRVRIEWHTLSAVGKTLAGDQKRGHFVFVGMSPEVLRILVTHLDIPHGTAVLISYRQAESTLTTLIGMKDLGEFKPYRGRIGLLVQELERRLREVPNPLVIERLRETIFTFRFDDNESSSPGNTRSYYKFELEGDSQVYVSGWVYRYMPDEDPPFRRAAASSMREGDFIFEMSDGLRAKLESTLQLNNDDVNSLVDPVRMLLKLYHDDVQRRCALLFKSTKRSALAREICAKMIELDPGAAECRPERVVYWLTLQAEGDTRPHAPKDVKNFKVFCNALGINDETAEQHWGFVRSARRLNQYLGRELVARYAEILFQPESTLAYRKVPEAAIRNLQQEALHCVYRIERIVTPSA